MQSHDQRLDTVLKPCKKKVSSKEKSKDSLMRSQWPRVTIFRDEKHGQADDIEKSLSPVFSECSTVIDTNDSNVLTCDIVDLFRDNGGMNHMALEERMTCTRISNSMEFEEDNIDVCSTCKDCTECQRQNRAAKIYESENPLNKQDQEDSDCYENEVNETASTSSTVTSVDYEAPILVDLTSEESKATWKQNILQRFGDNKRLEISGENAKITGYIINLYLQFVMSRSEDKIDTSSITLGMYKQSHETCHISLRLLSIHCTDYRRYIVCILLSKSIFNSLNTSALRFFAVSQHKESDVLY